MDLILPDARTSLIGDRANAIKKRSGRFEQGLKCYGTSIWDQSLYEAWGDIVRRLIPDLEVLQRGLDLIGRGVGAEECVLFERATFLTVTRVGDERGERNPYDDRYAMILPRTILNCADADVVR